jgi:transposase InsO family protein
MLVPASSIRGVAGLRVRYYRERVRWWLLAFDRWAYWNRVKLDFSRPGRPSDNAVCESFSLTVSVPVSLSATASLSGRRWLKQTANPKNDIAAHVIARERQHLRCGTICKREDSAGDVRIAMARQ